MNTTKQARTLPTAQWDRFWKQFSSEFRQQVETDPEYKKAMANEDHLRAQEIVQVKYCDEKTKEWYKSFIVD